MAIRMQMLDDNADNRRRKIAATGGYVSSSKNDNKNNDVRKYGGAKTLSHQITKNAQFAGSAANAVWSQPMFFSPLHTPQNWQIASKRLEVYQWSRFYYCFTPENKVLMSDGTEKEIKYIRKGDKVVNGHGGVSEVKNVHSRNISEEILSIKVGGLNSPIRTTKSHEVPKIVQSEWKKHPFTRTGMRRSEQLLRKYGDFDFTPQWEEADDIEVGDRLFSSKSLVGNGYEGVSLNDCYIIGLFLAEGSYYWYKYNGEKKNPKAIRFSLHDEEILTIGEKVRQIFKNDYDLDACLYSQNPGKCTDMVIFNVDVAKKIYEMVGNGCKTKKISEKFINNASKGQLESLMAGYIDGDGCVDSHHGCQIITASDILSSQIAFILEKIGITFSIFKTAPKKRMVVNSLSNEEIYCYNIRVNRHCCERLLSNSVKNKDLSAHHTKYREYLFLKDRLYRSVVSIEEEFYEGQVFDLELSDIHSYCVNRCVVHNSNEPKVAAGVDFYCFEPTMQVLMADGSQQSISSIREGDAVRSHDGSVNYVEKVHKRSADEEMLEIKLKDIDEIRVTKGHEFLTKKDGEIKFVEIQNLQEGDFLLTPFERESSQKEKYIYHKIKEINTYDYIGDVYDLTISNKSSYIVNRIAVHNSNFSMNGFKLECKSKKILRYYERLVDNLSLPERLNEISHEFFLLGDVFPFLEISCPVCNGSGLTPDGEQCNHPDGTFRSLKVLNPDSIDIKKNMLTNESVFYFQPDDELKTLIQRREPRELYEQLPQRLIDLVSSGQPIPLSNRSVSHIKHNASPYGVFGTSLIQRLFTILAYKTKLMTANWIIAERLILPVRVVKVGDKERPATEEDIQDVVNQIAAVANDPNLTIVTHHAFDYEWYGVTGKIHNITQELEQIGKEMLDGLMLNQAILNGEMASYSSAQVGIEILIDRLENWRNKLKEYVEKNIFLPVAMMQGFIDEEESKLLGETVYLYPKLIWNDLRLRDNTNKIQTLMALYDKGIVSAQTILDELELDYDTEVEKIRSEQVMTSANGMLAQGGAGNLGSMGMGGMLGGGDMGGGMPPGGDMGGADMGGGMPGGDMMGGIPGGDMGGGGDMGAAAANMPKITKRGKGGNNEEMQAPPPKMVKFTKLEQKMYKMLQSINAPHNLFAQYQVRVPGGNKPYMIDFAYPQIGVGLECLHPETLVPTSKGSMAAKDISVGDSLIGKNGDEVKIVKKYKNKCNDYLFSIKAMGMTSINVTKNHPFLVCKPKKIRVKRNEPRITRTRDYIVPDIENANFVNAKDICKGDFLMIPKKRNLSYKISELNLNQYQGVAHNANRLPDKVTINEDFAWLMGIYLAEGNSNGNISFSFHINEVDYANRVEDLMKEFFGLKAKHYVNEEGNCRRVMFSSRGLCRFFKENFGRIAPEKKMPQWVFGLSNKCKQSFLDGFCDGDGCRRKNNDAYRFISSSKALLLDIQALCFSINKFAHIYNSRKKGTMCKFGEREYKTVGLWEVSSNYNCKKPQYREDDSYFYVPIRKIKKYKYNDYVINFETEGKDDSNHTYLVSNIVTHNCDGGIWHQREDFQQRDRIRDQKLANVGWRILRFRDSALDESPDAVKDIITKNVIEATRSLKKKSESGSIIKHASNEGQSKNPMYDYMMKNDESLFINVDEIPGGIGQIITFGS